MLIENAVGRACSAALCSDKVLFWVRVPAAWCKASSRRMFLTVYHACMLCYVALAALQARDNISCCTIHGADAYDDFAWVFWA